MIRQLGIKPEYSRQRTAVRVHVDSWFERTQRRLEVFRPICPTHIVYPRHHAEHVYAPLLR